jgi:hypothetical protein
MSARYLHNNPNLPTIASAINASHHFIAQGAKQAVIDRNQRVVLLPFVLRQTIDGVT